MEKRTALLAVALIVVGIYSSVAFALPPMGPPRAFLGQEQWVVGVEYAYQEMDLETWGTVYETWAGIPIASDYSNCELEGLKSNIVLGRVGYGISDTWDIFVRLGIADAEGKIVETQAGGVPGAEYDGFEGSYGLAWGFGTRATFWREGDLTWGGLFQMTWAEPDDSSIDLRGDPAFIGEAELDFEEVQIAVGPTWQLDDFRIYGGPFYHFVKGDLVLSGQTDTPGFDVVTRSSQDIREESQFGGYAGVQWHMNKNTSWHAEYQFTGDAWGIGIGAIWRFE
ncbi:MAG: hypothetical protein ACYTFW_16525 [Planctomycetota bacterium]|jgi:hypothetical protein